MAAHKPVNVVAFVADHLGKVIRAKSGTISIGGIITALADELEYGRELRNIPSLEPGVIKIDMVALIK